MSSIKSVMEKHALAFQRKEIKRFNEAVAKMIDTELTKRAKSGKLDPIYFIELMPTPSHAYLVCFKETSDPTVEESNAITTFQSLLPISVFRNVFVEAYGNESEYYSHKYGCTMYYYRFNFVEIANK